MTKKQNNNIQSNGLLYYGALTLQRISLLTAGFITVVLWSTLIAVAHNFSFYSSQVSEILNQEQLNSGTQHEINVLTGYAVSLSIIAIILTLTLLAFPRVRKFGKKLVVDSLVIAIFLLVVSANCESIYRFILARVVN